MGEVHYPHTITLRTSIIGHELKNSHGLISWFLSQKLSCKGYTKAIFSGLPTIILARIIRDIVMPRGDLNGLYHVAARPISKFELLKLVSKVYGKKINIIPDNYIRIDRSLNAEKFKSDTGFEPPDWQNLIEEMFRHH